MIPVSLRLTNFMSYGADAPVLNFEQFHTACLSGDNGQGKSALLDGITWALWGKARKPAGRAKPAQDLLRVGQQEMRVEFVFDVEASRYRVIRSYNGEQGQSHLELHGRSEAGQRYRPLTGTNITETQRIIVSTVGLEYDTFINSALLLQGRSNEFANRKPANRKEILARILNLGRYDTLRQMAQDKVSRARRAAEQADADIARLTKAVEKEPGLKEKLAELQGDITAKEGVLAAVQVQEATLIQQLGQLRVLRGQVKQLKADLAAIDERARGYGDEAASIGASIAEAEDLIKCADAIKRKHLRWKMLQKERQDLEDSGQLHRVLERRREVKQRELADVRHNVELRLTRLRNQIEANQLALSEALRAESEAPALRRHLEAARAASRKELRLRTVRDRLEQLREKERETRSSITRERAALVSRSESLQERVVQLTRTLGEGAALEARQATLHKKAAQFDACVQARDATSEEGTGLGEKIKVIEGRREGREEQRSKARKKLNYLSTDTAGQCPTCGTQLTAAHRKQVDAELREEVASLSELLQKDQEQIRTLMLRQERLRKTWIDQNREVWAIDQAKKELAAVNERIAQQNRDRSTLADTQAELSTLLQQVKEKAFASEDRAVLRTVERELSKISFDEQDFERVRHEAAQVQRYSERLEYVNEQIVRKVSVVSSIQHLEKQERLQRRQLDDGTLFGQLMAQIKFCDVQLREAGFDPARMKEVRQELAKLSDAGEEWMRLKSAFESLSRMQSSLAKVRQRADNTARERTEKTVHIKRVLDEVTGIKDVESELERSRKEGKALKTALGALKVELGEIRANLAKAVEDRRQLRRRTKALKVFRTEAQQYEHLVRAFGRHGIPSLIIEETLPDVEHRANALLERLTDGKMRVRIDTLRDSKKGGTIETLDIRINDELGEFRAYETYSGGEAYRVNFALRIALSQLLAERSGVRVRFLVIDEGFGTQDQAGMQNLIQAIGKVQEDFDKILVITHLRDVKEAFPVRIEVRKRPGVGSHFRLIGV